MKIKYFAWVKDLTNKDYEIIENDTPKDVDDLKKFLNTQYPNLNKYFSKNIIRFAINQEYISTNQKLNSSDEIALFPPVSGG